ncbi:hypothetical protein HDU67_002198 [Dinochytrium kinnereticum]|nr:hypothetical protein HDU67_002198 [Dinochytrium kinnereticum]
MDDIAFLQEDLLLASNLPFSAQEGQRKKPSAAFASADEFDFSEFLNTPSSPVSIDLDAADASLSTQASPAGSKGSSFNDADDASLFFDTSSSNFGSDMYETSMQTSAASQPSQALDSAYTEQDILAIDPAMWLQAARTALASRAYAQQQLQGSAGQTIDPSMFLSAESLSELLAPIQMAVATAAAAAAASGQFEDLDSQMVEDAKAGVALAEVKPEPGVAVDSMEAVHTTPPIEVPTFPAPAAPGRPRKGTLTKKAAALAMASADAQAKAASATAQPPKKRSRTKKEEDDADDQDEFEGDDQEFLVPLPHKALDPDLARQYALLKDPSLSSKERRQLRNKLSARSFRERRKDYIEALEGEVRKLRKDLGDSNQKLDAAEAEKAKLNDMVASLSERLRRLEVSAARSSTLAPASDNSIPSTPTATPTQTHHTHRLPLSPEQEAPFSHFGTEIDSSPIMSRNAFGSLVRSSRFSPASAANQASMRPSSFSPLSVHTVMLPEPNTFPHTATQQHMTSAPTPSALDGFNAAPRTEAAVADPEILSKISKLLAYLEKSSSIPPSKSTAFGSPKLVGGRVRTSDEDVTSEQAPSPSSQPGQPASVLLTTSSGSPLDDEKFGSKFGRSHQDDADEEAHPRASERRGGRKPRLPETDSSTRAAVSRKPKPCTIIDAPLATTPLPASQSVRPAYLLSPKSSPAQPKRSSTSSSSTSANTAWKLLEVARKAMKNGDLGWLITAVIDELFPAPPNTFAPVTLSSPVSSPARPRTRTTSSDLFMASLSPRPAPGKVVNAMDVDSLVTKCLLARGVPLEKVDLGLVKMVLICLLSSAGSSNSAGGALALAVAAMTSNGACGVEGGVACAVRTRAGLGAHA